MSAGRKRGGASQQLVNKDISKLIGVLTIIKNTVDICAAVIKLWEKESYFGHFYDPVTDTVLNAVSLCVITEPCFGKLYRADTAHNVIVNLIRCIEHLCTIRGFTGNIVDSVDQYNIVVFRIIIVFDNPVIEVFNKLIVSQLAASQSHKKMLGASLSLLVQREFHVHKIFTHCTGQRFAENLKIFKHFLLRERKKGFF